MSYIIKNGSVEYNGIETKTSVLFALTRVRFYPISRILIVMSDDIFHVFRNGEPIPLLQSAGSSRYFHGFCDVDDDHFVLSYSSLGVVLVTVSTMTITKLNISTQCPIAYLDDTLVLNHFTGVELFKLDLDKQTTTLVGYLARTPNISRHVFVLDALDRFSCIEDEGFSYRISIINGNKITKLPSSLKPIFSSTSPDRSRFAYLQAVTRLFLYSSTGELLFSHYTQDRIYLLQFNDNSLVYYTHQNPRAGVSTRTMHTVLPDNTVVSEVLPNGVYAVIPETGNILL
jgi:hypothetical protein